jgi:trehalose 6-phosphate phosphatase
MEREIPPALANLAAILARLGAQRPVVFLDFDGTLAGIVDRPELATIDAPVRAAVARLARACPVAVISGRDLDDVRQRVGVAGISYAGSHGLEIAGPHHRRYEHPKGIDALPALDAVQRELAAALAGTAGVQLERKRFALAVHYRRANPQAVPEIEQAVTAALRRHHGLRRIAGKMVIDLQPDVAWHKGAAVRWLLQALAAEGAALPIYLGDDVTDEDAFRALADSGIGIVVMQRHRPSAAQYRLRDPREVHLFLQALAAALERSADR